MVAFFEKNYKMGTIETINPPLTLFHKANFGINSVYG